MTEEHIKRKLAAIFYADVAGYSRLTGADEAATHRQLSAGLDLISSEVHKFGGTVVHYAGDAVLADFSSAVAAVECANEIQSTLSERNAGMASDKRLQFRIGVNLGEVIVDRDDIFGDGVNVAARLESLAEPGGICVSGAVYEQVKGKLNIRFQDMGHQSVKNIVDPVRVYCVLRGAAAAGTKPELAPGAKRQDVRYCTAPDGVRLAYATVGQGPPLVKTANWLNHLEYDWQSPIWRHVLYALADENLLIRYDPRATGLSDWEVPEISFEAELADFETVIDAMGIERFPILGISQGCTIAIAYAVTHPDRVSGLILYGGYLRGRNHRGSQLAIEQDEAMTTLIRLGWGQENPAFRQIFTSLFVPGASSEQMQWFNDLQRITTTPENAVRIRKYHSDIEVTDLARRVSVPTLVLHVRGDGIAPFEEGRRIATEIPGARFVALEGQNHLILENEPAWPRFREEVTTFLAEVRGESN